jgi:hypothetical protein
MKSVNPDDFDAKTLFFVHHLMTKFRYSLRARKFLFMELLSHVVLTDHDFEILDNAY